MDVAQEGKIGSVWGEKKENIDKGRIKRPAQGPALVTSYHTQTVWRGLFPYPLQPQWSYPSLKTPPCAPIIHNLLCLLHSHTTESQNFSHTINSSLTRSTPLLAPFNLLSKTLRHPILIHSCIHTISSCFHSILSISLSSPIL